MSVYQPPDPYGVSAVVSDVATLIAQQYGVDSTRLVDIALATMVQESGGNPHAVGDNGTSFGLFQLHEGGELGSMSEQQAFDPASNARIAIAVMAQVLRSNPSASDGQIAAMAQRPADQAGYAQSVNSILSGGGVTGATDGSGAGNNVGSPGAPVGGGGGGQSLSMNDIPAVDQYIRQNWGSDAWLLDIPEVKGVLEKAAVQGLDPAQIQAAIEQTNWWKTTSTSVRQYEQDIATNPGDYNFNVAGSKAAGTFADVMAVAGQYGVNLNVGQAQQIALSSLRYGWTSQQVRVAVADTIIYNGKQNTAPAVIKQLQGSAGQYLMNITPGVAQSWAENIAGGTQTIDQFNAYLAQNASVKWSGMAPMIKQGLTPNQIVDSYRQEAAKTMEVDPNSIDFVNNPTYSKILDYVPPPTPGAGGKPTDAQHRMMTMSEMDQHLKSQPAWQYTQNARDSAAGLAHQILQTWGIVS